MQIAKVQHYKCDEPRGMTLVWVPDKMTKTEFNSLVEKAKQNYLAFVKSFHETPKPNDYSYGFPPYSKYPDKTVAEVEALWRKKKEEYETWNKEQQKAYHPFGWYLEELGLQLFWQEEPDLTVNLDWGHVHGGGLDTSDTKIEDLPGIKPYKDPLD